ncbi:Beta-glucanase [Georgfuchsia toluolica]|uniref:Beta-glucanase n=1 Tax=Georgfuchsia toluolica TaxID=424218 RepID=A0A916NIC6_9PROT|nr:glycoside hydrolase family 16 protein [Georgfuchsia toluolica]CAG4884366.1 Beta-glucanase [Georgfuchsia toluolica]
MTAILFSLLMLLLPATVHAADWELAWSDEFNYSGLPDESKWGYEGGFTRNEEAQWYSIRRKENARVENGLLILEARKEQIPNPGYKSTATNWRQSRPYAQYTSASLITKNKASWAYGRIEVRAKLPKGKGLWPAIWTIGANIDQEKYPKCGEIDIMEYYGKIPDQIFANLHFDKNGARTSSSGKMALDNASGSFHVFAIEWDHDRIDFFVDQVKYHSFAVSSADSGDYNAFRNEHYLLINLAMGGASGGSIDDSILPAQFLIDYVRVYRHK